jgi:trans-aconitate methyltransferase
MYACKRQALRRALAAEGLRRDRTFSVLDGGCGQGQLARFYQKEFPASSYVGLDISERAITHLRQSMSGAEWYVANLSALQDDEAWRQALAGLADRMAANGVLLVTAALPDQTEERSTYLRYRSRAQWNDAFVSLGLRIAAQRAMYYWLPSGGPANKYFRYALTRFESVPLYLVDRAALTLGLPRPSSVGLDSRTHLLTLRRA